MRQRTSLNIILVIAVVGLAALLWFDRDIEKPKPPITKLKRSAIHTVELRYPDAPTVKLQRGDGGWRLTAPVAARAETSEVKQILRLAEATPKHSYPADEIDASETGLDKPRQTVIFDGNTTIALGDTDALEDQRYARVGDTVYLINPPTKQAVDADYSNLVARRLLPKGVKLSQIELPQATLTRNGKGGWAVSPKSRDKGADAAQWTADAWGDARALWIKPAQPQRKAESTVRVHTVKGQTLAFDVVARKPQLILRRPDLDVAYHVAANQAGPLLDMEHPAKKQQAGAADGKGKKMPGPQTRTAAEGIKK